MTLEATNITDTDDLYDVKLGDVIVIGEGDDMIAHVAAPFGWEMVKFEAEWRSPA